MIMRFTRGDEKYDLQLNDGNMIMLSDESRYKWKHELLPVNDKSFYRGSITFRTIE